MAAYIVDTDLEAFLGRALTAAEDAQFATAEAAVRGMIDRYTGRSWDGGTIDDELHTVLGPTLTLARRPVTAITTVRARAARIGATWATLTANTHYELIDALNGILYVSSVHETVLEVTYTVGTTLPGPVKLAAEIMAASMLAGGIASGSANAALAGVKRWSVDGESIEYATTNSSAAGAIPADARALLDAYRKPVVFV